MWHTITLIPCMTFIRYSRVDNKLVWVSLTLVTLWGSLASSSCHEKGKLHTSLLSRLFFRPSFRQHHRHHQQSAHVHAPEQRSRSATSSKQVEETPFADPNAAAGSPAVTLLTGQLHDVLSDKPANLFCQFCQFVGSAMQHFKPSHFTRS